MSSYISTKIDVEEERLRGIVRQCDSDLQEAEEKLKLHQDAIRTREEQRRKHSWQYQALAEEAKCDYHRAQEAEQADGAAQRAAVERMMRDAEMEVSLLTSGVSGESLMEQLRGLRQVLQDGSTDLSQMEDTLRDIMQKAEHSVGAQEKDRAASLWDGAMFSFSGTKGVSLRTRREAADATEENLSQEQVFAERLEYARSAPAQIRPGALEKLGRAFEAQPDYARVAFAVRHMEELEKILRKLQKAHTQLHGKRLRYQALCQVLGEPADEHFLKDDCTVPALDRRCREMEQRFRKRRRQAYVTDAVRTVMERHHIPFAEHRATDGAEEMVFGLTEDARLSVSGMKYEELVMEVRGISHGGTPTLDERRRSAAAAHRFCPLAEEIEEELRRDFGIVFSGKWVQIPDEEDIVMESAECGAQDENRRRTRRDKADAL